MPHIERLRKALVGNEPCKEMRFSLHHVLSSLTLSFQRTSTYVYWSYGECVLQTTFVSRVKARLMSDFINSPHTEVCQKLNCGCY